MIDLLKNNGLQNKQFNRMFGEKSDKMEMSRCCWKIGKDSSNTEHQGHTTRDDAMEVGVLRGEGHVRNREVKGREAATDIFLWMKVRT